MTRFQLYSPLFTKAPYFKKLKNKNSSLPFKSYKAIIFFTICTLRRKNKSSKPKLKNWPKDQETTQN